MIRASESDHRRIGTADSRSPAQPGPAARRPLSLASRHCSVPAARFRPARAPAGSSEVPSSSLSVRYRVRQVESGRRAAGTLGRESRRRAIKLKAVLTDRNRSHYHLITGCRSATEQDFSPPLGSERPIPSDTVSNFTEPRSVTRITRYNDVTSHCPR